MFNINYLKLMTKKSCLTIILIFSFIFSNAQEKVFPKDYFISPLDIPLILSGTFGELRPNHFHAGIDFKTKGESGLRVYSIANGYVSRIKVSPTGYGKAIYVTHPNGYTSVYAHLMRYNDKIESIVKKEQYLKKSFAVEIFPEADQIIVSQGDIIALSGNTGSSFAPHLHFEIRDTKTQKPQNGMHFGFNIKDNIPPILKSVKLYRKTKYNGIYDTEKKNIIGGNGNYYIDSDFTADTTFGISVSTYDLLNGANNKNGVYKVELFANDSLVFMFKMDEFSFSETKYIKSHCDFHEKTSNKVKYHKCFKDPRNKLSIYDSIANNGFISFDKNQNVKIKLAVSDFYDNKSYLSFNVLKEKSEPKYSKENDENSYIFVHGAKQTFKNEFIEIESNKNSFYEVIYFKYTTKIDSSNGNLSRIHQIHNSSTPIHNSLSIKLSLDSIPENLTSKLCLAKINNNYLNFAGGKYVNGKLEAKIYSFGDYTITADTIKPSIKGLNIYPGKTMKSSTLKMTIKDDFSGIKSYEGKIDGKWVIMEYDPKRNRLTHYFEKNLEKGKHNFELKVIDNLNNENTYNAVFYY